MAHRKRLWEVDHSYYCNNANYYSNEALQKYSSVEEFLEEYKNSDMDYNLLFRWDWKPLSEFSGEDELGEVICLYFMQQRRGKFVPVLAPINPEAREEEEKVLYQFISERWAHLKDLWEPFV